MACPLYNKWRLRHDVKARAWGVPDASHATRRSWRKCRALVLLCSACVMYSGLWCCREMSGEIVSWQPRASWQLYRVRAMIPPNRTSPCSTCWRPSRTSGTAWTSSRTLADWVSTFSRKHSQPLCPSLTLLTRQYNWILSWRSNAKTGRGHQLLFQLVLLYDIIIHEARRRYLQPVMS